MKIFAFVHAWVLTPEAVICQGEKINVLKAVGKCKNTYNNSGDRTINPFDLSIALNCAFNNSMLGIKQMPAEALSNRKKVTENRREEERKEKGTKT